MSEKRTNGEQAKRLAQYLGWVFALVMMGFNLNTWSHSGDTSIHETYAVKHDRYVKPVIEKIEAHALLPAHREAMLWHKADREMMERIEAKLDKLLSGK